MAHSLCVGRDDDSHKKVASQETGTRMVIEEQMESCTIATQNSGGPLKVTKMLAAVVWSAMEERV
jgi:hypothetical protein